MSLYSVRFVIRAILEIPSGIIADALGRIKSLLTAYSFYIFSFVAYFLAESFFILLIPSVLFGIGDAFRTGTHKAMIIEYLRLTERTSDKTTYYGHTRSWSQAGSAISALIAATIVLGSGDIDIIFLASIIPLTVGFLLLLSYPKELDGEIPNQSISERLQLRMAAGWKTLSKRKNLKLFINTSFYFGYHHAMKDLIQPIIQSVVLLIPLGLMLRFEQETAILVSLFYFASFFLSSIASRKAGIVSKLFKTPKHAINWIMIIGISISLIISVLLWFKLPVLAVIVFLPFFSVVSLQRPLVISELSENINNNIMATALSMESQIGSLIAAFLAFITGMTISWVGLGPGICIVSIITIIIILVLLQIQIVNEKNRPI